MIYFDTETCGLHGMMVLLQYAEDDGEIKLYDVWKETIGDTLYLLEQIAKQDVCGFNLAFDWFHVSKIYSTFSMAPDFDWLPEEHIDELAIIEERARLCPLCIKPKAAMDLMLHSKKGPFQSLMDRKDVKVRRVPNQLCEMLRNELEKRVELDGIYFARRKNKNAPQWSVRDSKNSDGEIDPAFKDIVLSFSPSGALKVLAEHALGETDVTVFKDIEIEEAWKPKELGYAPYALAVGKPGKWNWAWPEVIHQHIIHWGYNRLARKYAEKDVDYTRRLHYYFKSPEPGDVDSELACMVGAVRWRGFKIDEKKLKVQKDIAIKNRKDTPTAPTAVKPYLQEVMTLKEQIILAGGTGVSILESIAGTPDKKGWMKDDKLHPAAIRAREVIDARRANKEIELFDKLLLAGRFHASFKVIGTKSSRMSGADGLNPQGINSSKEVRGCFLLAEENFALGIGDFDAFEVCISEAVYKDPKLRADLLSGKKIHALFAMELFDIDYDTVMGSKGSKTKDYYTDGKRGVFGMNYGGDANTLVTRLGIDEETAEKAYTGFGKRYPGIANARKRIVDMFCSMTQPGGIGTQVIWKEPADYIESLLGFRRYFTLENRICRALFDLAQNPPTAWTKLRLKVRRRERLQTVSGAVQSALYGAAFAIQGANMRAGANHEIQSTGADITKYVQNEVWKLQPSGVYSWQVQPMNAHDEIAVPCVPELANEVERKVLHATEKFRNKIPLIKMEWNKEAKSWAEK